MCIRDRHEGPRRVAALRALTSHRASKPDTHRVHAPADGAVRVVGPALRRRFKKKRFKWRPGTLRVSRTTREILLFNSITTRPVRRRLERPAAEHLP